MAEQVMALVPQVNDPRGGRRRLTPTVATQADKINNVIKKIK